MDPDGPGRIRTGRTDPDGPGRTRTDGRTDGLGRTDGRTDGRTHQPTKLHYKDKVHPVDDCLGSSDANLLGSLLVEVCVGQVQWH
jgi:hypothetical protein